MEKKTNTGFFFVDLADPPATKYSMFSKLALAKFFFFKYF